MLSFHFLLTVSTLSHKPDILPAAAELATNIFSGPVLYEVKLLSDKELYL